MDTDTDPALDRLLDAIAGSFVLVAVGVFVAWLLIAILAAAVAPDDRPWSFFWCTFLLLGPVGVVCALIAPSRPDEGLGGLGGPESEGS